ncbi:aquaporin-10-like isoform X2 [Bacillus rossius redtenbacheri]
MSINITYALAVSIAILVAGGLSGAHVNPAVTVALAVLLKFPRGKVAHYLLAQYLGGFIAAPCTYLMYHDALANFDGGNRTVVGEHATAGIWATYPQDFLSLQGAFLDQVLGTGVLMLVVCAVGDQKNMQVHRSLHALYVGLTVLALGAGLGYNCGYPLNPARDLSPRLFLVMAGWGSEAFVYKNYWWVPIVGPHVGAILGCGLYSLFEAQFLETEHTFEHELTEASEGKKLNVPAHE